MQGFSIFSPAGHVVFIVVNNTEPVEQAKAVNYGRSQVSVDPYLFERIVQAIEHSQLKTFQKKVNYR